ncbi:MAG: hypothetical protein FWF59_05855 [Turicibacter sp.]|nr:hypothetical protein [Turicibacter sp.]
MGIKIIMQDGRRFEVDERNRLSETSQMLPPLSDVYYDGIDVSQWQEDIDWNKVAASGIDLVYIRAGKSGTKDWNFEKNYVGAKAAGMKVGFYYFITAADPWEAREQARYFYNITKDKNYNLRLVGDYEDFGDNTPEEANEIALAFFDELEGLAGHRPMLYTSYISAEEIFDYDMSYYPLWIAHYNAPGPLPQHPGTWEGWYGYQYAEDGRVPGISTLVDKNYFIDNVIIR